MSYQVSSEWREEGKESVELNMSVVNILVITTSESVMN